MASDLTYAGRLDGHRRQVVCRSHVAGRPDAILSERRDLISYPDGLDWGNRSGGAAQCAVAILAHHFGDDLEARSWHQRFAADVVSAWPRDRAWTLAGAEIDAYVGRVEAELELAARERSDATLADRYDEHFEGRR